MKSTDLYWGPSFKTTFEKMQNGLVDSKNFIKLFPKIEANTIPKNIKYSFHQSGQMHLKQDGDILDKSDWISCQNITQPKLIFGLITKKFKYYPDFNKKLRKEGVSNYIIKIPNNISEKRLYFEFFISPFENKNVPEFSFNLNQINLKTEILTRQLNERYFLHIHIVGIDFLDEKLSERNELFYYIDKET